MPTSTVAALAALTAGAALASACDSVTTYGAPPVAEPRR